MWFGPDKTDNRLDAAGSVASQSVTSNGNARIMKKLILIGLCLQIPFIVACADAILTFLSMMGLHESDLALRFSG